MGYIVQTLTLHSYAQLRPLLHCQYDGECKDPRMVPTRQYPAVTQPIGSTRYPAYARQYQQYLQYEFTCGHKPS